MTDPTEKSRSEQTTNPTPSEATRPEKTEDSKSDVSRQTNHLIETGEQNCKKSDADTSNGFEVVKETLTRKTGSLLHTLFQKIENFSHDMVLKTEKAAKKENNAVASENAGKPIKKSGEATTAPKKSLSGDGLTPASGKTAPKKVAAKKTPAKKTAVKKTAAKKTASKKDATEKKTVAKKRRTKKAAAKKQAFAKKTSPNKPNP